MISPFISVGGLIYSVILSESSPLKEKKNIEKWSKRMMEKKNPRQPRGFVVNEKQFVFSIFHDKLVFSPQITELVPVRFGPENGIPFNIKIIVKWRES